MPISFWKSLSISGYNFLIKYPHIPHDKKTPTKHHSLRMITALKIEQIIAIRAIPKNFQNDV